MTNPTIYEVASKLKPSYKYIDFRAAYYKDENNNLKHIVSVFRFTNKEWDDIDLIHTNLKANFENSDLFHIEFEILSLDQWESKWNEINDMLLSIQKNFNLNQLKLDKNIRNRRYTPWISENDLEFNSIQFNILIESPQAHHNKFQFLLGHEDLRSKGYESIYPIISKELQIKEYNINTPLYSTFIFPIYSNISNLNFTNRYLVGDIEFNEIYQNSRIFIEYYLRGQSIGRIGEFLIEDRKDEIQDENSILNKKLHFRIFIDQKELENEPLNSLLLIKFYFQPLNLNVLEYESYYDSIRTQIKNIDILPQDLLKVINPILEFNLIERREFHEKSKKYIKELNLGEIKLKFQILKSNIEWLENNENKKILNDFFISAANQNNVGYFNVFRELIIFIFDSTIKQKLIEDNDLISRINDFIIQFNIIASYDYKLYSYNESLEKIHDKIKYIYDKYFRREPKCHSIVDNYFLETYNIEFPNLFLECHYAITEDMDCVVHLIYNNPKHFDYNNIYIHFWIFTGKNKENIWADLDKNTLGNISRFINEILNLHLIELKSKIDIPYQFKIGPSIKKEQLSEEDLLWIKQDRFSLVKWKFEGKDYDFKRFNIFVGKNNSGKTYALEKIYLERESLKIDNPSIRDNFKDNYRPHESIEFFFIPKSRVLDSHIGKRKNPINALINFFQSLDKLKSNPIYENTQAKEFSEQYEDYRMSNIWKIPNFLQLIDLCSYDYKNDSRLESGDIQLINSNQGEILFRHLEKTYQKWVDKIEHFFPDIRINRVKDKGVEGDIQIEIEDKVLNRKIYNWEEYGSGTHELFNLIFLIEFLKCVPAINSNQFKLLLANQLDLTNKSDYFIAPVRNNRVILIDEPEISLHPSLQKDFFQYLYDSSQLIQIFIATQSSHFLEIRGFEEKLNKDIAVFLCKKESKLSNKFLKIPINKLNYIKIIDEIFNYNPLDTAFYLSKNNYQHLLNADFEVFELDMIKRLQSNRSDYDSNFNKLKQLGTLNEVYDMRLIQNVLLLISNPLEVDLNDKDIEIKLLKQIIICPMNKNKKIIENKKERYWHFIESNWDINIAKKYSVLKYNQEQKEIVKNIITTKLSKIKENGIEEYGSLLVFPENSIPYDSIEDLIDYAKSNKIIIVGGMEHSKVSEIELNLNKIKIKYPNRIFTDNYKKIVADQEINDDIFINQAIIINADQFICFQIKNVPFYHLKSNSQEGIPIIFNPYFKKIKTVVGNVSVFICKDFLVNYEIIDKWMDKNNIRTIVIPSFTGLVNPFRNKFGDLIHNTQNTDKSFIFVNMAEYGGSGIYNYKNERDFEPGEDGPFKSQDEKCRFF